MFGMQRMELGAKLNLTVCDRVTRHTTFCSDVDHDHDNFLPSAVND